MHALAEQPPLPPVEDVDADERIRAFVAGEYRQVVATVAARLREHRDRRGRSARGAGPRVWSRRPAGTRSTGSGRGSRPWHSTSRRSQMRRWRSERRARTKLGALRPEIHDVTGATGDAYAVRQALLDLPRRQREVTALRYYLGLDVRAIAEHLGIAEGTVKAMLFRARQSLAVALGDDDPDQEPDRADA